MNKIQVIKRSVRTQWLAVWCLIPLVGLAFAATVLHRYRMIRAEVGNEWNPAQRQLTRAMILAGTGTLITVGLAAALAIHLWLDSIAHG